MAMVLENSASNLTINPENLYKFIFDLDIIAVFTEHASVDISLSSAQTSTNTFNVPITLS